MAAVVEKAVADDQNVALYGMTFDEAFALVEKASNDATKLSFHEGMRINYACAILAMEYVRVADRIMSA